MSTHNVRFCGEIRKISTFQLEKKKATYPELLFVMRFYGPVNQTGHVKRSQFTYFT